MKLPIAAQGDDNESKTKNKQEYYMFWVSKDMINQVKEYNFYFGSGKRKFALDIHFFNFQPFLFSVGSKMVKLEKTNIMFFGDHMTQGKNSLYLHFIKNIFIFFHMSLL